MKQNCTSNRELIGLAGRGIGTYGYQIAFYVLGQSIIAYTHIYPQIPVPPVYRPPVYCIPYTE